MRLFVLLTLVVVSSLHASVAFADEAKRAFVPASWLNGGPRVRASDARIIAAIADGVQRSSSFLNILNEVERRDVIVYVEMQPLLRSRLSGSLKWVTKTTQFRYVRVSLNPELPLLQMVATLAHELQHVAEVGLAPSVVDSDSLTALYRSIGLGRRNDEWDTEAAMQLGETVRRELSVPTDRVADSIQPSYDRQPVATRRD